MGVDREHERDPARTRLACPSRLEIEPMRIAVDLDRRARLGDRIEHLLDAERDRRTARDETPERMSPNLEDGVTDRTQHAFRHLRLVLLVTLMNARNDDIELLEDRVRPIERAVGEDVGLRSAKKPNRHALLHLRDLVPLAPQLFDIETTRVMRR
jgi:hypothetical protein